MGEYAVLIESSDPLEGWEKYADELVGIIGKTRYDVARIMRNARGVAFEGIDVGRAERAAAVIGRMGRRARAVGASDIPSLDPVYTIRNADCTPDGLMIQIGYAATLRALSWGEVRLISACSVQRTTKRRGPALGSLKHKVSLGLMGLSVTTERKKETRRKEFSEELCDIFTLAPVLHVRFNSRGFNYDYLGERLTQNALNNFYLFVSDLVRMSPNAHLAADAGFFAEGNYPPEPREPGEFDAVNRHALAVLSLGA